MKSNFAVKTFVASIVFSWALTWSVGGYSEFRPRTYREAALGCLDNLLEHGRDRYGPVHTPMFMSVIDTRTNDAPREPEIYDALIRTEGRLHRRNPGGCDLFDDQPLLRALYTATDLTGDAKYWDAADAYIESYFERSMKPNGLLAWGTHIYYDAYKDAPGGDQDGAGPHEILIMTPEWEHMHRVVGDKVDRQIELMWEWHVVDKKTGLHNRHDDKQVGCDFAFFGGELAYAFAYLASVSDDPRHLEWAKTVADRHWNERNTDTNLAPDAPSTRPRYDSNHSFSTLPGPHSALLLKAFAATGEPLFKDRALAYIKLYTRYGWDESVQRHHGMLKLDGTPIGEQKRGAGYDQWIPTGPVDVWRSIMFSYEFPLIAAQTALYAYELTGDADALEAANHWATEIQSALPVQMGRRWREDLLKAVPALAETNGSNAENYGRAISFFLSLHYATKEKAHLDTAVSIADDALAKLRHDDGWIVGSPGKPYYESTDGVPILLNAFLQLSSYPKPPGPNL